MVTQPSTSPQLEPLEHLRSAINDIDDRILDLLLQRQKKSTEIGKLKKEKGLEVIDPAREEKVLDRLTAKAQDILAPEAVRGIFMEIIKNSRLAQQPLSVAFLGPEGTFSHQAVLSVYGVGTYCHPAESIEDIFKLVEKDICRQGMVPVENSFEGSIAQTLDLFFQYNLSVAAETFVRIRNHLVTRAENLDQIKRLYSHPMPIAQCRSWIKGNLPRVELHEVGSTSVAVKLAAEDPEAAAIAGSLAAEIYQMKILMESIEDHPHNVTRFLSLGKSDSKPSGRDKTTFLFSLKHEPGSLHSALAPLAERGINITHLESRPMKVRTWEYLFYADIEGHREEERIKEALSMMNPHCAFMKVLGSYPAGRRES
ncbi:MAG: prephenate dehydratase [Deltaproteobacteria bacterium]|nr:prephenate dehydratase [Deltaproteobacteria bacterium]